MAKITLDNGIVFEGTVEEVKEFLNGRTEDYSKIELKFKVGDYVKVVGDTLSEYIPKGSIVKITEINEEDIVWTYHVKLIDGNESDWCDEDSLEPVNDEEKEQAKWKELGRKPGDFKVGDAVKVLDSVKDHTDCVELIVPVEQRFDLR